MTLPYPSPTELSRPDPRERPPLRRGRTAPRRRWLAALAAVVLAPLLAAAQPQPPVDQRAWWKEAVVYQIYPRSFQDSNGDGVGDIPGIISRLDYIQSLGVDVVWLNPIFASPNEDNGYDISDYEAIMPQFGTMADFDRLLAGMHQRGLKLVLDLVANHCSSEHPWFQQARKSRENPYRNYFHWWNAEKGPPPKRWSFFAVDGSAWTYDPPTNSYYLHYFSPHQPDLNWENPRLRQEIYRMMRFWLDKGVDGFRMDVIPFISKDTRFPELPARYHGNFVAYYADGPHLHEYLREMNREVLSRYDAMTVAEGIGVEPDTALKFVDPARHELNMLYHFDGMALGYLPNEFKVPDPRGWSLVAFKDIYTRWNDTFADRGWGTVYLGNHDQPRMTTRWGDDRPEFRARSSEMLTTFLLTQRATPYYYFGDELGMTNIKFDRIEDYRDIETLNMYRQTKNRGGDLARFLAAQKISARDNGRTPFQWSAAPQAGFTTGTPWLRVNPNYTTVNVATEEKDPRSPLNYFRALVRLRKSDRTLVYGRYAVVDHPNPDVYAYTRTLGNETLLVLLNFRPHPSSVNLGRLGVSRGARAIGNYQGLAEQPDRLRPYEAAIYRVTTP
ncbi:MAG TPA: alpha-glucosidase [Opitutaceae bacterium]|nr:alpha-glucosidase [Opitutaceae bacterium]